MAETILFDQIEGVENPLTKTKQTISWIKRALQKEGKSAERISFVFCTDDFLLSLNQEYLSHDDYTDILTFPIAYDPIEADIYISVDRVKDNAQSYNLSMDSELHRVIIHGVLHMCGYEDKEEADIQIIRKKEDNYLNELESKSFLE